MIEDIHRIKFVSELNKLSTDIHKTAYENGFWDEQSEINRSLVQELRPAFIRMLKAQKLALIHEEVSETLSAIRHSDKKPDKHLKHHKEETVELADTIIRIVDYAQAFNLPIWDAVLDKVEFNKQREKKHGKKF